MENMIELYKGKKVSYHPMHSETPTENGIVKSICEDGKHAFVVFNCAGNWHKYENYTAQRTRIVDLKEGWSDKVSTKFSNEYLSKKNIF